MSDEPHPSSPDHPDRIAANLARYAKLLADERPVTSEQLRAAFLSSMEGKEYGNYETIDAFDWFWEGWAKSSGSRTAARPEETPPLHGLARFQVKASDLHDTRLVVTWADILRWYGEAHSSPQKTP